MLLVYPVGSFLAIQGSFVIAKCREYTSNQMVPGCGVQTVCAMVLHLQVSWVFKEFACQIELALIMQHQTNICLQTEKQNKNKMNAFSLNIFNFQVQNIPERIIKTIFTIGLNYGTTQRIIALREFNCT